MSQQSKNSQDRKQPGIGPGRGGKGRHSFLSEKPQKANDIQGTLLRIWTYFKGQTLTLILVFFLVALSTGLSLVNPFLFGRAIDTVITDGDIQGLVNISLIMVGIALGQGILVYYQTIVMAYISQKNGAKYSERPFLKSPNLVLTIL